MKVYKCVSSVHFLRSSPPPPLSNIPTHTYIHTHPMYLLPLSRPSLPQTFSAIGRITMTHSFVGEPSLIPYGMGQDQTQRGVVQIPLHYSVRQTVDFVRAVFTRDRQEYPSSLEASSLGGRGKGSQEGGLLQADTRQVVPFTGVFLSVLLECCPFCSRTILCIYFCFVLVLFLCTARS